MTKSTLEFARTYAECWPDQQLPCPLCASLVMGKNLVRHLDHTHLDTVHHDHVRARSWVGPERLVARPLIIIPVLVVLAVVGGDVVGWYHDDRLLVAAGAALGMGVVLAAAASFDTRLFRGRLTVGSGGAVLTHTLGLRRRRLRCVDRLEFGSAYERRPDATMGPASSDGGHATVDVSSGSYLRMRCGRRHVTVHCTQASSMRKVWSGWARTPPRRRWHITLDAAQFVQLQYVLADLGLLAVRVREV